MSLHRHPAVRRKTQEALRARDALAAALSRAGIQLPAMDVRTPWHDEPDECRAEGDTTHPVDRDGWQARYPLVHLGACPVQVAYDLAEVIERGASARAAGR